MAEVRRATPDDVPAMVAMGRALHDESPRYRDMPFSERKLVDLAARLRGTLLSEDAAMFVATAGDALVGMAVVVTQPRFFNDERFLTDLTVYVKPEHRGGRAFLRLVNAWETWAVQQGVLDLAIGVSTEINAQATVCAYERLGYRLAGYTMVKSLRHGH